MRHEEKYFKKSAISKKMIKMVRALVARQPLLIAILFFQIPPNLVPDEAQKLPDTTFGQILSAHAARASQSCPFANLQSAIHETCGMTESIAIGVLGSFSPGMMPDFVQSISSLHAFHTVL
jgi:hypothetical protein